MFKKQVFMLKVLYNIGLCVNVKIFFAKYFMEDIN